MGIKQLYNDNLRKLPNKYGDVSIMILHLVCYEERAFYTSDVYKNYKLWSCQNVCEALIYLLDNIFIIFGTEVYRKTIGIPIWN